MFRVSKELYEDLGRRLYDAFEDGKENIDNTDIIRKFNCLYFLDCAIKDLIEDRYKQLKDEGVL